MLFTGIMLGFLVPFPGLFLDNTGPFGTIAVGCIFLLSGLKLNTKEICQAIKEWKGIIYGIVGILFLTPAVSFVLVLIPYETQLFHDLIFGLAIFFIMPTTLSSGVILTRLANGNFALALLLTVVTNLAAILLIPFVMQLLILMSALNISFGTIEKSNHEECVNNTQVNVVDATSLVNCTNTADEEVASIELDPVGMLIKLSLAILAPLVVGKIFQHLPGIGPKIQECTKVKKVKIGMKLASTFFLAIAPWLKVSKNSCVDLEKSDVAAHPFYPGCGNLFSQLKFTDLLVIVVLGVGIHLIFFGVNYGLTIKWLPVFERKAVIFMASQKTLPVSIAVIEFLPDSFYKGIAAISCVIAHFVQILIDSVFAAQWESWEDPPEETAENDNDVRDDDVKAARAPNGDSENTRGLELVAGANGDKLN